MKKKALVIVAHPDDEIIWMGGLLIRNAVLNKNWEMTIISLCRRDDKDRAPKFAKVCEFFNARGFMSDLEDEKLNSVFSDEIKKRIMEFAGKKYDYIFTHGENGEYGHIRHKEVHKAVCEIVEKKLIFTEKLFFFAYLKNGEDCYADKNANKFIKLKKVELIMKQELITNIYGFQKNSFEERNCRNSEAFNLKR